MESPLLYHRKANGKLLLTSEYFVLDNAKALACPTHFGQRLGIEKSSEFLWQSYDRDGKIWLEIVGLEKPQRDNKTSSSTQFLIKILNSINEFQPHLKFQIFADFPLEWGLGSSSTLLALLADYFQINPYELNQRFFQGSGYDIACAFSDSPLLFSNNDKLKPEIQYIDIPKEIKPFCYFVYLNQKQNSREGINHYRELKIDKQETAAILSELTEELVSKTNYQDWIYLLNAHEELISKSLKLERINKTLLKTIPYFSKSLGAWGGDFALIITDEEFHTAKDKMNCLGFNTFIRYISLLK